MNNLEKYLDQVIEQKPVVYESPGQAEPPMPPSVLDALRRRWYIAVLVTVLIVAAALPAVWLLIKPRYVVTGAIHVAPLQPRILTGEPDRGEISDYDSFMNTQAAMVLSTDVLQGVANQLKSTDLAFFREDGNRLLARITRLIGVAPRSREPVEVLRKAITKGTISATPLRRTELISVTVKSRDESEATRIVNAFRINFKSRYDGSSELRTNKTLQELKDQEKTLSAKIDDAHDKISQQSQTYGTTQLDSRQQMEMQRQTTLWTEQARLESREIGLKASIAALEQAGDSNTPPEALIAARKEYINADSMVKELTTSIVQLKRDILIAKQRLAPENPEIAREEATLATFEESLKEKEAELTQEFEAQVADRAVATNKQRLASLKAELGQILLYKKNLAEALTSQETTTKEVGKASVNLQDLQFDLGVNQQLHEQIVRRINDIEMERQRGTRIQTPGDPEIASIEDKRAKYSAVVVFLALGCGFGLAILRDRMDKTLQSPDDVTRQLDLPVIGTTTSSRTVKAALFAEHLASDYQTIRTNLSLLTVGGMPKKLAVSSAGTREGKTTFAVNLATSLAKSGKKVLLVDGDLRKPDIGYMLGILNGSAGLQDVLLGGNPNDAIHLVASSGLHVLLANPRNLADAYELLTSTMAAEQIERLSRQYDHLIVDTPPALAFPDALVWAKLTDAVVLVSFAGQTTAPELKEARERFGRIRAHVLGAVLSNVPVYHSLYRSNYGYRPAGPQRKYKVRRARRMLLLGHGEETGAGTEPDVDAGDRET
jgi:succinoglycan biosynthesis transport protein ExoP